MKTTCVVCPTLAYVIHVSRIMRRRSKLSPHLQLDTIPSTRNGRTDPRHGTTLSLLLLLVLLLDTGNATSPNDKEGVVGSATVTGLWDGLVFKLLTALPFTGGHC